MFTWEEAGQLRGMLQVLGWLFVILLVAVVFWAADHFGWLATLE